MRSLLPFILLAGLLPALGAQDAPPAGNRAPETGSTSLLPKVRGLFDFDLPDIDPPGTVKLTLHPHLGDLIRRDYLRLEAGLRWAVNDQFEFSPAATVYFTHGLKGSDGGYGIGELRLGTKYVLRNWPDPDMETSVFLNIETPVGHPPVDLTDGLNHFAPGFLVQHHSSRNSRLTTFAGAGVDLVSQSNVIGTPVRNVPLDDSLNFTAGAVYDLGQIKWTISATYATTAGLGDLTEHYFYLRPNLLWSVPRRFTLNSKTNWLVGLGLRASWGPDGSEVSFRSRVRAEITFRQVMQNIRNRGKDPAPRP